MNKYATILMLLFCTFISCQNKTSETNTPQKENKKAKELLQGIWLDNDSDTPFMHIKGDTIYYVESRNAPVYFRIVADSLYLHGNEITRYQIDKQTEYTFWFHSLSDHVIKLYKSENLSDTVAFAGYQHQVIPIYNEVTQKDNVVMHAGKRYRGYVYINPSTMKVSKTTYSEDGMGMDNVYYDNIIHICVYEGKNSLYASDITKQMFADIIDPEFLRKAILSDMNFMGIKRNSFYYQAFLCVPESYVCNMVNLYISFTGELSMEAEGGYE
ncbi:MAG: DUF4738 domain-containing protein [Bacteroides sp.]|nr:DUF4738 domain-containing protein [Bacteroides sp.]